MQGYPLRFFPIPIRLTDVDHYQANDNHGYADGEGRTNIPAVEPFEEEKVYPNYIEEKSYDADEEQQESDDGNSCSVL